MVSVYNKYGLFEQPVLYSNHIADHMLCDDMIMCIHCVG